MQLLLVLYYDTLYIIYSYLALVPLGGLAASRLDMVSHRIRLGETSLGLLSYSKGEGIL